MKEKELEDNMDDEKNAKTVTENESIIESNEAIINEEITGEDLEQISLDQVYPFKL